MATTATRKETSVLMRFGDDDLNIIDRGAKLLGLSRTQATLNTPRGAGGHPPRNRHPRVPGSL